MCAKIKLETILSFCQQNKKACIGGTIIAALAITAISLLIAQLTDKIDLIKFGQTKAGKITYGVMGGTIAIVGLGALSICCRTQRNIDGTTESEKQQKMTSQNSNSSPLEQPQEGDHTIQFYRTQRSEEFRKELINNLNHSKKIFIAPQVKPSLTDPEGSFIKITGDNTIVIKAASQTMKVKSLKSKLAEILKVKIDMIHLSKNFQVLCDQDTLGNDFFSSEEEYNSQTDFITMTLGADRQP